MFVRQGRLGGKIGAAIIAAGTRFRFKLGGERCKEFASARAQDAASFRNALTVSVASEVGAKFVPAVLPFSLDFPRQSTFSRRKRLPGCPCCRGQEAARGRGLCRLAGVGSIRTCFHAHQQARSVPLVWAGVVGSSSLRICRGCQALLSAANALMISAVCRIGAVHGSPN